MVSPPIKAPYQRPFLLPPSSHCSFKAFPHLQTATLYDLAVHPSLHGLGIGQRLVRTLVHQLHAMGIYDIGAVSFLHMKAAIAFPCAW